MNEELERIYPYIGIWGEEDNDIGYCKVLFIKENCGYVLEASGYGKERLDGKWYDNWREKAFVRI